jgi:flagellar biosynthetic protein FliR
MNGHLLLLGTLAESFYGIPPGLVAPQAGFGTAILPTLQNLFLLAFRIALPAVGVLIVVEIGLGLLARLVPNLNVFFVGAPAKILLGLTTVVVLLPAFSLVVGRVVMEASASMERLLPLAK